MTVVTDLGGAHPTWFNNEADKVFIASDAVMRVAFREGLKPAQVGDECNAVGLSARFISISPPPTLSLSFSVSLPPSVSFPLSPFL